MDTQEIGGVHVIQEQILEQFRHVPPQTVIGLVPIKEVGQEHAVVPVMAVEIRLWSLL